MLQDRPGIAQQLRDKLLQKAKRTTSSPPPFLRENGGEPLVRAV